MMKMAPLFVLLALLGSSSIFAATEAKTIDQPGQVVSAGNLASTIVEPALDLESVFQVSSKVESPLAFFRGVCSISCEPCVGSCGAGQGRCTFACN
jgi:hypothetical protein